MMNKVYLPAVRAAWTKLVGGRLGLRIKLRRYKGKPQQKAACWSFEAFNFPAKISVSFGERSVKVPPKSMDLPAMGGQADPSCAVARLSSWGCGSALRSEKLRLKFVGSFKPDRGIVLCVLLL